MIYLTTEEAAARLGLRPQTLRANLCRAGHYLSIRPTKLPNRLLRWPASEIERLLSGNAVGAAEWPTNTNLVNK